MAKLRFGFIGCGSIANSKHFPGVAANADEADMVAFCDLIIERAQAAAAKYGTPDAKVYTDYHDLLADPTIDAVHVLTPNVAHCEITVAAFEAGKHVLCEKPMAATKEDAKKMIEARDKSGKLLTIGYQYRHFEYNKIMKKAVEAGTVGDIYYAEASAIRRRGVPTRGVFTDKSKQGGGPLIDIGTHALDLTLWMMQNYEVESVTGVAFEKLGKLLRPEEQGQTRGAWDPDTYEVEDSAFGFIRMKNGAVINLRASWAINMADTPSWVLLCGTKGGLDAPGGKVRLNNVIAGQLAIAELGAPAPRGGMQLGGASITPEAKIFIDAINGKGELFVKAEEAYTVTRVLDAIYESSRTGKTIYFND